MFGEGAPAATPEEQIQSLKTQNQEATNHNENLAVQHAIAVSAIEHGVGAGNLDYYTFLLNSAGEKLKEGEELSAEQVAEIAQEAKSRGVGANGPTSVDPANPPPPIGGDGQVTVEQFSAMTINEKSALFAKNKPLYDQLLAQARQAGTFLPKKRI